MMSIMMKNHINSKYMNEIMNKEKPTPVSMEEIRKKMIEDQTNKTINAYSVNRASRRKFKKLTGHILPAVNIPYRKDDVETLETTNIIPGRYEI